MDNRNLVHMDIDFSSGLYKYAGCVASMSEQNLDRYVRYHTGGRHNFSTLPYSLGDLVYVAFIHHIHEQLKLSDHWYQMRCIGVTEEVDDVTGVEVLVTEWRNCTCGGTFSRSFPYAVYRADHVVHRHPLEVFLSVTLPSLP